MWVEKGWLLLVVAWALWAVYLVGMYLVGSRSGDGAPGLCNCPEDRLLLETVFLGDKVAYRLTCQKENVISGVK